MKVINDQSVAAASYKRAFNTGSTTRAASNSRAVGDAFVIAQMSRVVIQKAMQAAALLKNIAGQALASDSVNQAKLETAVSMIPQEISMSGASFQPRTFNNAGLMPHSASNRDLTMLTDMIADIEAGRTKPPDALNIVKLIEKNPSLSHKAQGNVIRGAVMRHLQ